ncbi:MBL fold metallo-hydrolase [Thioclava sp. BHET1]|uniref:Metallo-beta-lactamase n=1 Tax=Thioclava dalianensis TaxID=1185766 RepID=A0A074TI24_9RHOB|nr:MBL fold metallo-hydrolase [Thioclava dalianensis]KEP71274.1 metallo-beta-lactamase [Thioclava dalianensis]TMV88881.1 MBL fold metallo-hydrolase [Thioclava sp. BHET1]SFM76070.1 Glyoxylase, beta-lactamase superfamily II [Thioclava dalianensis]
MNAQSNGIRYPWAEPPEPGGLRELAPGVHWLRLPLPMVLNHVNCYVLDDGDGWTVVDPGMDTPKARDLVQAALDGPLAGKPVRRVLITHYHPDHIGLAGWFQARGAELVTTRTSWLLARMLVLDRQERPAPETLAYYRQAGMDPDLLARRAQERPFNFADCVHPLPLGFTRIVEGDVIRIGGRDWDVRMGDGHAPEHATLWSRSDDLVLGGDQLLPSISANLGVYSTEIEADPLAEWLQSCARFSEIAEARHLVLPGHKLPFTGLPLRLRQMIENHEGALNRLRAHLETPRVACDCFAPLFKRQIDETTYGLALVEAMAHLNHLWHKGEVTRVLRDDGVWEWSLA